MGWSSNVALAIAGALALVPHPSFAQPVGTFEMLLRGATLAIIRNDESVGRTVGRVSFRLDTRTGRVRMCLWGNLGGGPIQLPDCVTTEPIAMGATEVGRFRAVDLPDAQGPTSGAEFLHPAEFIFFDSTDPSATFICSAPAERHEPLPRVLVDSECRSARPDP